MADMTLSAYLALHKITVAAFGDRIGRDRGTVSRLATGASWPDRRTAEAILEATGGVVTPNDFMGIAEDSAA